jgi:hypothetical protein
MITSGEESVVLECICPSMRIIIVDLEKIIVGNMLPVSKRLRSDL